MKCATCGITPEIIGTPDAADHFIPVGDEIRCTTCIYHQSRVHDSSWLAGILVGLNQLRSHNQPRGQQ